MTAGRQGPGTLAPCDLATLPTPARCDGVPAALVELLDDPGPKRLEVLREVMPSLRTLAIVGNFRHSGAIIEMDE
jgi:hypothetical protein